MKASDIMTEKVIWVRTDTSAGEVPKLLARHNIGAMPVLDHQDRLAGIVSQGDFLRYCLPGYVKFLNMVVYFEEASLLNSISQFASEVTVADIMTRRIVWLPDDAPLAKVVSVMLGEGVKHIPILSEGKLVGIVSRTDIIRLLAGLLKD